jgi:hypothetical protein
VLDLEVADRVDRRRPSKGLSAHLRQADMADMAGLHHLRNGADGLFDRHIRVQPRRPVDVHVVGAQPLEGERQAVLDGDRTGVEANGLEAAGGVAPTAELHADRDVLALAFGYGRADQ